MGKSRGFSFQMALCVLSLLLVSVLALVQTPQEVSAYTPHDTIFIIGNAGFTTANGVSGGSGTPSDPYIIEGWEIDASFAHGIEIRNTDAHFTIRNVYVHSGGWSWNGIYFRNVDNGRVEITTITGSHYGIYLESSTNATIRVNDIYSNTYNDGIHLNFSANVTVMGNEVSSNNGHGIWLDHSTDIVIMSNNLTDNWEDGIHLQSSVNVTIMGNNLTYNSGVGIWLDDSNDVTIMGNIFVSEGIFLSGVTLSHFNSHTIATDNLVNNLPVYYYKNCSDLVVSNVSLGQLLVANCTNVYAANLTITDTNVGIEMAFVDGALIRSNNLSNIEDHGVYIYTCTNITIEDNDASWNNYDGIRVHSSSNIAIDGNKAISNTWWGIYLDYSDNITIENSNASSNRYGMYLRFSTNVTISGNDIRNNGMEGIDLYSAANITIVGNSLSNNEFGIWLENSSGATIVGNSLSNNDWGIYFYHISRDAIVTNNSILSGNNYGLYLLSSHNVTISGNNVSNNRDGIRLNYCTNITIADSTASSNNEEGISLSHSNNSIIANNRVSGNGVGIDLDISGSNKIYHNNFVGNAEQARDNTDANQWDDGYPSGGNYWSNYTGVDNCSGPNQDNCPDPDVIGDTPYVIDADSQDRYPLMFPVGTVYPRPPTTSRATLSGQNLEDLTIIWALSPDDGSGLQSVVGYEIYRGTTYNPKGLGYGQIASLPNGTSSYVDYLAGEGNPNTYFYRICAIDIVNTSCADTQAGKFTRQLTKGLNLVSIPLIQSDESTGIVLQTVEHDKAWHHDSSSLEWKWHMTFKSYERGLWNVNHTMGVWVNVTQDSNLTVAGIVPAQTTIHLHKGWNLVGVPSFNASLTVADLRAVAPIERVEAFEPSSPPHFLRVPLETELLLAGEAYWMKASEDTIWVVSNT
ncbi:MAG: nitrous oxide reductase family maturation protein NosD [Thermoplasmata archaeon]